MLVKLENSAVATGLEKVSFHSSPKEGNAKKKKSSKYSKSLYKMKNQSRAKLKMWGQSPRKLQLAKCV